MPDPNESKKFLLGMPRQLYARILQQGNSARGGVTNEILRRLELSFASPFDVLGIKEAENHYLRLGHGNTGADKAAIVAMLRLPNTFDRFIFAARPEDLNGAVLTVVAFGRQRGAVIVDNTFLNLARQPRITEVQTITATALHSDYLDRLFFATKHAPDTSKMSPPDAAAELESLPVKPLTVDTMPQFLEQFGKHWTVREVHNFVAPIDQWVWD